MRTDILQQAQAIRASMDAAAIVLTDEQAAKSPRLYPTWAAGLAVKAGDRLYKVVSDHTTQSDWTPDAVPALYTVIDVAHAGTQDDPISAERGMEYVYGLYYTDSEDGKLYLCQRTGEAAGGTVVLQYLPHELVGHYFVAVS